MAAATLFTNPVSYRNLSAIQDREICCYSISCKEKDNIGKKWLLGFGIKEYYGKRLCCGDSLGVFFFQYTFFKAIYFLLCSFGACPGISSYKPGWPRAHRNPPASAS